MPPEQEEPGVKHELIEECELCDGPIDANEPGHYKSPDERFRHRVCHEEGVPDDYVVNLAFDNPKFACVNRTYNCGHIAYGPQRMLTDDCPECDANAV